MNNLISSYIYTVKYPEQLHDHAKTIIAFNQYLHDKNYKQDRLDLEICVLELLYDLLKKWSFHNQTSSVWKKAEPKDFGNIIFIHSFDEATNVPLQIGLNKDGIFIEMGIACPENLPVMPDDFWIQWLSLNSFGNFRLTENEVFSDMEEMRYPEFFPGKTSNIFRLMRNIIAFPLINERPMQLGNLSITWPYHQYSIAEVFNKGCLAFERMHYLNKMLVAGK